MDRKGASLKAAIVLTLTMAAIFSGGQTSPQVAEAGGRSETATPGPVVSVAAPESVWSIGVLTGLSPFDLGDPRNVSNPVLTGDDVTDIDATLVAHPFWLKVESGFLMFFTAKNRVNDEGEIGLAESGDGFSWEYRQIVLKAPYHLAYPLVFEWRDQYYMIPEGVDDQSVRLYRATEFPTKWALEKVLLSGKAYISASVVRFRDRWWMFVGLEGNETLLLYYADDLTGPWIEHPRSPIVERDKDIARPGGRPLIIDGKLYRLGQDCYPTYGSQVSAFEVTELSETAYSERMVPNPIVKASSRGWNAEGMHHVDAWQLPDRSWIAAVDGVGTLD